MFEILPDIDVHDLVILSQVRWLDAAHGQDTGAVDQDVQPAEASDSLLHRLLHRLLVSKVSRNKQRLNTKTLNVSLCPDFKGIFAQVSKTYSRNTEQMVNKSLC